MEQQLRGWPQASAPPAAGAVEQGGTLATVLAIAIATAFATFLLGTVDFPFRTHADEPSKVLAVVNHWNNYNHPLLMLHLARAGNAVAGLTDPQSVAELGRALAVAAGALAVFATYLLEREVLPPSAALAAAAATAVTPLVAMHARFFKEDIFVLPLTLLSLLALIALLRTPTRGRALLLGRPPGLPSRPNMSGSCCCPSPSWCCWSDFPKTSSYASGWSLPRLSWPPRWQCSRWFKVPPSGISAATARPSTAMCARPRTASAFVCRSRSVMGFSTCAKACCRGSARR